MTSKKIYTSSAELQDYLIQNIAPNYFDFNEVNNYRSGLFGYINEAMSVITMDTHRAMNVARQEFYPVSAQNPKSFYKMAAVQKLPLPMATPSKCRAVLLIDRDEIIENSTYKNGVYSCVIDDSLQIMAGNYAFCLLYPIVILSSEAGGEWTHTIHYDRSKYNDLDNSMGNYGLQNKTFFNDGVRTLAIDVTLYQCARDVQSDIVTTDASVETVTMDFGFTGSLANFEAFYIEEPEESKPVQLVKLIQGEPIPETPFCYYKLLTSNQIELSFPRNVYFTPDLNSEIRIVIYTSDGSKGVFPRYMDDLACTTDSDDYPYNNNMTILGRTNGASAGGKDTPTMQEYQRKIIRAYSTCDTTTTANDLQMCFEEESTNRNKVYFRKKRDDAFDRTFGAYMLLRDINDNVVPTNTLSIKLRLSEFDTYNDSTSRATIKPGTIFEYDPESFSLDIYTGKRNPDLKLMDEIDDTNTFYYTNPFLIACTMNPNLVGYYINSLNEHLAVDYTYVNDGSLIQFLPNSFDIVRNSIAGEDFYEITLIFSPTIDLNSRNIVNIPTANDPDYYIRAEHNGWVTGIRYDQEVGTVVADVFYSTTGETDAIQIGSYVDKVPNEDEEPDIDSAIAELLPNIDDGYYYHSGYKLNVSAYEPFIEGDIIAIKKVDDKGRIRAAVDLRNILYDNSLYIPLVIEEYNDSTSVYTMRGYISTDDILSGDYSILINNGIHDMNGDEDDEVAIPYSGLQFDISMFYKSEESNMAHKYSEFDYFRMHTMTNTYSVSAENGVSLMRHIDYIRSTLIFNEADILSDDDERAMSPEIEMTIKEIPLVQANWLKTRSNFEYFTSSIQENFNTLQDMYRKLENDFGFDLKFYNTYGKSKFFKAGIRNTWKPLSQVNCVFRFGAYLTSIGNKSLVLSKLRTYVKNAIEKINDTSQGQQSIYILNLTKEIQNQFSELGYLEYYGFNDFGEDVQKIEPVTKSEMSKELLANFIPEFINIATTVVDGETVPCVEVEFLNVVEPE